MRHATPTPDPGKNAEGECRGIKEGTGRNVPIFFGNHLFVKGREWNNCVHYPCSRQRKQTTFGWEYRNDPR